MRAEGKKCACEGGTLMRFIQPIVLSVLARQEDYGYSILQKVADTALWHGSAPDSAGLYRVLRDMEARGLLVSRIAAADGAGMMKRIFTLTGEGRHCLQNWHGTLTDYRADLDETIQMLESALALTDRTEEIK